MFDYQSRWHSQRLNILNDSQQAQRCTGKDRNCAIDCHSSCNKFVIVNVLGKARRQSSCWCLIEAAPGGQKVLIIAKVESPTTYHIELTILLFERKQRCSHDVGLHLFGEIFMAFVEQPEQKLLCIMLFVALILTG